jgi:putative nucleotidyltransferase with HDIG domain
MRLYRKLQELETAHEYSRPRAGERLIVIGRPRDGASKPDLDLSPDVTVSRCHAILALQANGDCFLEDAGSTHGTKWNGRELRGAGRVRLRRGDLLRIGDTLLRFGEPFEENAERSGFVSSRAAANSAPSGLRVGAGLDARVARPSILIERDAITNHVAANARLDAIYELPLQFAAQTQLPDLLQLIVAKLVELIPGARRGALVLREDSTFSETGSTDENDLQLLAPQAFFPQDGPPIVSRMLAWRAMRERSGFIWQRGEENEVPARGSIVDYGIESGMYVPLLWQDKALGAVCVDNGEGGRAAFFADDLRLMLMASQYAAMAVANQQLQEEMRSAWRGALEALTSALASRDSDTQSHCYRTVELTVELARALEIPEGELPALARGALLHDIGKIGIPDDILLKPGALSDEERAVMKSHSQLGYDMLHHIPFFQDALPIVLHHHEHFDGNGYPLGLRGEEIPRGARIFHVVDLYDALTHARPYKKAWSHKEALAEITRLAGKQCDAEVVVALASLDESVAERISNLEDFSPAVRGLLGAISH